MGMYYARNGDEITLEQCCMLLDDWRNKRVKITEWGDISVSTVWLGLDHNFDDHGPPLIFETMIFGGDLDEHCWRWPSEVMASFAHDLIVGCLQTKVDPDEVIERMMHGLRDHGWNV